MTSAASARRAARETWLRSVARALRHGPDRLLHRARSARLRARLSQTPTPRSVLFVCLGNINRSAYAAAAFSREVERLGARPLEVGSAGFIGPGRPASDLALQCASARGLDLVGHSSRLLNEHPPASDALVVVMSPQQARRARRILGDDADVVVLGDLDPLPIHRRLIPDPHGRDRIVFDHVFDRIDRCVRVLAEVLAPESSAGL